MTTQSPDRNELTKAFDDLMASHAAASIAIHEQFVLICDSLILSTSGWRFWMRHPIRALRVLAWRRREGI